MIKRIISSVLVLSVLLSIISTATLPVYAADQYFGDLVDGYYLIDEAVDLVNLSQQINETGTYSGAKFKLVNDIDLSAYKDQVCIGNEDFPFCGEFDGNGHTIKGLAAETNDSRFGLFGVAGTPDSVTVIKNLTIEGANLKAPRIGGILAGETENVHISNVTVRDSSLEMWTKGSIIELVTAMGIQGGGLVGYAKNTKIYNCESNNNKVFVDTVGGVQALGGDAISLGGLVGMSLENTTIEYSRVIGGAVANHYSIAVGAASGKILYSGGIVGFLKESQVIDSFSTASVSYYTANYVSVGSGSIGYAAGIAGYAGESSLIERCHFAGKLNDDEAVSGYLYNGVLVIPIILENKYLYGILGKNDDSNTIKNSYYHWDNVMVGKDDTITAVNGINNSANYEGWRDSYYSEQSIWETREYDFEGTVGRNTGCNDIVGANHYNKWVMDDEEGMPVHGKGVTVAIDWPKTGGSATIGATSLKGEKTITEGYYTQITSVNEENITVSASVNSGFRFKGWYDGEITANGEIVLGNLLSTNANETFSATDNAVYIAHVVATATYYEADETTVVGVEEYGYEEGIKLGFAPSPISGKNFYGWTEEKAYTDATNIESIQMVDYGTPVTYPMRLYPVYAGVAGNIHAIFEQTGTNVGTDSNLATQVTNQDGKYQISFTYNGTTGAMPDGYKFDGWYRKPYDATLSDAEKGNIENAVCVSRDPSYILNSDELLDSNYYIAAFKYRVKFWLPEKKLRYTPYEMQYSRLLNEMYLSHGTEVFPTEMASDTNNPATWKSPYTGSIVIDGYDDWYLVKWTDVNIRLDSDGDYILYKNSKFDDLASDSSLTAYPYGKPLAAPLELYAVINQGDRHNQYLYYIHSDFPGSSTVDVYDARGTFDLNITARTTLNDGYNFVFYDMVGKVVGSGRLIRGKYSVVGIGSGLSYTKPNQIIWETDSGTATNGNYTYYYVSHNTADISFYNAYGTGLYGSTVTLASSVFPYMDGSKTVTMTRRWHSKLFGNANNTYVTYDDEDDTNQVFSVAEQGTAPTTWPQVDNYKFIGWTEKEQMDKLSSTVRNEVFDIAYANTSDPSMPMFVSSDVRIAKNYVYTTSSDVDIERSMKLYPVYVPYDITIKTNLDDKQEYGSAYFDNTYICKDNGTLTITVDKSKSPVFVKIEGVDEQSNVVELTEIADGTFSGNVEVGKSYTFTVYYRFDVNYHLNKAETSTEERYYGDRLGKMPEPKIDDVPDDMYFSGWTISDSNPANGYFEGPMELLTEDYIVKSTINVYPVYEKATVITISNIDDNVEPNPTNVTFDKGSAVIHANNVTGYEFEEWVRIHDGKEEYVSATPDAKLTPEQVKSGDTFKAYYNPIVTFKIPIATADLSDIQKGQYTEYQEVVPYGEILDSMGTPEAFSKVNGVLTYTDYVLGGWSRTEGGNGTPYQSPVTEPITLYPIYQKMISVQYKWVLHTSPTETVTKLSAPEKYLPDSEGNHVTITLMGAPDDYYIESGSTRQKYMFHRWKDLNTGNMYLSGSEYALSQDTVFEGVWNVVNEQMAQEITVWSNYVENGAGDTVSTVLEFDCDGEQYYAPRAEALAGKNITPDAKPGIDFVGYAFVTIGEKNSCDHLYEPAEPIAKSLIEEYNGTADKRIYAVWAEIETNYGAQVRLDEKSGLRVMGLVNTKILERIGMYEPDSDYKRYMLFAEPSVLQELRGFASADYSEVFKVEYFREKYNKGIAADSHVWNGNIHYTAPEGWNTCSIILGYKDNSKYVDKISYRGFLKFRYDNGQTKNVYGEFSNDSNTRSVSEVARGFMKELGDAGVSSLPERARNLLNEYIVTPDGEILN